MTITWGKLPPDNEHDHVREWRGSSYVLHAGVHDEEPVPVWNWKARVKRDGCIELYHWFNGFEYLDDCDADDAPHMCFYDRIHLCDLDQHIEAMIALRREIREHFGDKG